MKAIMLLLSFIKIVVSMDANVIIQSNIIRIESIFKLKDYDLKTLHTKMIFNIIGRT